MIKDDDATSSVWTAWIAATSEVAEGTEGLPVNSRFQPIVLRVVSGFERLESNETESNDGFVDRGIALRSSLGRRVIGKIYGAYWGGIVLDSERSVSGALCISSVENHSCED